MINHNEDEDENENEPHKNGSIREKVKQHWGWVEKIAFLIKKRVNRLYSTIPIEIWLF